MKKIDGSKPTMPRGNPGVVPATRSRRDGAAVAPSPRMTIRILLLSALLGVAACGGETPTAASSTPTSVAPARNGLTRVEDPSLVCMVNNQMMGKPQIPVEVEGRTYFGCCAMCKDRLTNDPAARQATDPVTGEVVDKATAVIAQDDEGAVYYFASADHVARFTPP